MRTETKANVELQAANASSTAYWVTGRSMIGGSSSGMVVVAGGKRLASPASGMAVVVVGGGETHLMGGAAEPHLRCIAA